MDIKIDCLCGTRYGFDVEPEDGRMPTTVACPGCGTDGTGDANQLIQAQLAPRPAALRPVRVSIIRPGVPAPSSAAAVSVPGPP